MVAYLEVPYLPPKGSGCRDVGMMLDQVRNLSHQMRLFGIHQSGERRAAEALAQQLHPLEFLRLILEEELLSRQDRTATILMTRRAFVSAPTSKTSTLLSTKI